MVQLDWVPVCLHFLLRAFLLKGKKLFHLKLFCFKLILPMSLPPPQPCSLPLIESNLEMLALQQQPH